MTRVKTLPNSFLLKPLALFEKIQESVGLNGSVKNPVKPLQRNGTSAARRGFIPKINLPKLNFKLPNLPYKKLSIYALVGVAFFLVLWLVTKSLTNGSSSVAGTSTQIKIKPAKASQMIEREFLFPLTDANGVSVSQLRYFIEKAEKMDEIVVKGQRATAIKGRTFLIITLKIANDYNRAIEINTKDYIRLSVNGNQNEWLAPDVHNDPVLVQASSTKFTRVGFPINDSDNQLLLRAGEIEGAKEFIELGI